jgi:transposase-like protein
MKLCLIISVKIIAENLSKTEDAVVILEFDNHITKYFAVVIPNKKAATILPIIYEKIYQRSTIYTDEHRSYLKLNSMGFIHDNICHKYTFVNQITEVQTQAVENFNNCLKVEIVENLIKKRLFVLINRFNRYFIF